MRAKQIRHFDDTHDESKINYNQRYAPNTSTSQSLLAQHHQWIVKQASFTEQQSHWQLT